MGFTMGQIELSGDRNSNELNFLGFRMGTDCVFWGSERMGVDYDFLGSEWEQTEISRGQNGSFDTTEL